MDKRASNGGKRTGAGRPVIDEQDKKITTNFQIMRKHQAAAKVAIQNLIDERFSDKPQPIDPNVVDKYEGMSERTKQRLLQLQELGLKQVRLGQFGKPGFEKTIPIQWILECSDKFWQGISEYIDTFLTESPVS